MYQLKVVILNILSQQCLFCEISRTSSLCRFHWVVFIV